jgi:LuxR family maltose regulon positive regulatory protein
LPYDLMTAKLSRPPVRPGTIRRSELIDRLSQNDGRRIVSVAAPAGYGKTTLLSQWAEASDEIFAWLSVNEEDNDPKVLLTYIAEALNAVEPVSRRVFDALADPASSVPGSVVPRLGSALSSVHVPVTLVLDDVHLLHNSECRAALSVLADHVPAGSRLVLAGRAAPPLRTARLRAEGRILEISPPDLALTRLEASSLLHGAGVGLSDDQVAELHRQTEGWPAGLYLAVLYLREGGSLGGTTGSFGGDDRLVAEYMQSEFLARISRAERIFLTRTAVLQRMCGPLCETVLGAPGGHLTLETLARSNLLLVPLDRRGHWYRYHHLFRDMLLAELERREPGLIPELRRRAATWCAQNDLPEEALEYSMAAGDVAESARLVQKLWLATSRQGRVTTLQRWFQWLNGRGAIEERPALAVWAAFVAGQTGRPAEADRWADVVDRWHSRNAGKPGDSPTAGWAALLRAILCRRGVEQMRADADEAARNFAAAGMMLPVVALYRGIAQMLCADPDGGDAYFEQAVGDGDVGAPDVLAAALSYRSLIAIARGQWGQAETFAEQARSIIRAAGTENSFIMPLISTVRGRLALHRGDVAAVRQEITNAQRLRHLLTHVVPHQAVTARIEMARIYLALADLAGARTLMREIDELLRQRPGLGVLVGDARALRAQLARENRPAAPGPSALTTAELRLLPLLSTHLSFPEVAAELSLSPHTVKSQAYSIYRKLGAASRSQAVTRSRELALLEG